MTSLQNFFTNRKVLVFGLGLQGGGEGDVKYLLNHGAIVRITDKKTEKELEATLQNLPNGLDYTLGGHNINDIDWADIILVNPGVPLGISELVYAKQINKPIISRSAFFVKHSNLVTIGITGTRGKSTTTALIYKLLDSIYPNQVILGGNNPGISDLMLLDELEGKKFAVLELSSFQLEHFHSSQISPNYAVVTNLYPDHLNRYKNLDEYALAKSAICKYQSPNDVTIYNLDNAASILIWSEGVGQKFGFSHKDATTYNAPNLPGLHNRENMAATIKLAKALKLDEDKLTNLFANFQTLPYRLETIAVKDGVTYINDTTSTTPIATEKAIETITNDLVLILGGAEKGLPTDSLFRKLTKFDHVKKIVIIGSLNNVSLNQALSTSLKDKVVGRASSMQEAVDLARNIATSGQTILLSPGFASFDLFINEFDRGRQFNDHVAKLVGRA